MRKTIYLLLISCLFVVSCEKDNTTEYLFDKSINERFEELKTEYDTKLKKPENGWIGYYNANETSGAYTLLLKFQSDGTVVMHSDYASGEANATITYRISKKQDITLTFESWSVLHAIYEIDNNNFGGEYVFNITEVTDDNIVLTSKTDNGYAGEEVTQLVLTPANASDWDLDKVYESAERVAGDETKSVFRNFKKGDNIIGAFSYDEESRSATISYIDGASVSTVTGLVKISPTGFCFIKPVTIGNTTLDCFTYNTETGSYESSDGSVKLVYDMKPGVPLAPYPFGKNGKDAGYNYLDLTSSKVFLNFWDSNNLMLADYGIKITRLYLRDLSTDAPYFHIYTNLGKVWFDFTYEIKEDGKVYFTLTGANNAGKLSPLFEPLLAKIVNTNGHYIEATGTLKEYSNATFSLINADDPAYVINFYAV